MVESVVCGVEITMKDTTVREVADYMISLSNEEFEKMLQDHSTGDIALLLKGSGIQLVTDEQILESYSRGRVIP